MYFHKIASALGMQCIVAVSSVKQMIAALRLPGIRAVSINNRNLATWALDTSRVDRILGDPEGETQANVLLYFVRSRHVPRRSLLSPPYLM